MSYPIAIPIYKSHTEAYVHCEGLHNLFKNSPHPIITSIRPYDFVDDHFVITLKSHLQKAMIQTPRNRLPENKQFNHHWILNPTLTHLNQVILVV
ncbi:unnamed protein product [Linum trigynum]|uniref:Uncharacterized protein n=1 Tax=Linum trigynum TaxID=586398 RepID=A0AAV2DRU4_9ROSI